MWMSAHLEQQAVHRLVLTVWDHSSAAVHPATGYRLTGNPVQVGHLPTVKLMYLFGVS